MDPRTSPRPVVDEPGPGRVEESGPARTIAEAYVYLELTMPERDSAPDYDRYSTLISLDDRTWLLAFDGPYEDLWVTNAVTVDKATEREAERAGQRYGVGRSTLVDAGQWYAVEVTAATNARDGMARLAAGTADDETYWMVVDALATAAAATEEIEKFIPADTEDVPAEAFWTEIGQRMGDHRRDALRRLRLRGERAFYLRQLDQVRDRYAADHGSAEPAEPATGPEDTPAATDPVLMPGPRGGADRSGTPLPARTLAEAYLFMDACPCVCGSAQFLRLPFDVLSSDAEGDVLRHAGPCDACGRPRGFDFRYPRRPALSPDSPHRFSFPEDGPSEILDPGDWAAAADAHGTLADAVRSAVDESPEQLTDDDRTVTIRLLSTAAYALDEAVRFLPPDADAVPLAAFWTESGRAVRDGSPERFTRRALTEWRADRWRRLDDFLARYGGRHDSTPRAERDAVGDGRQAGEAGPLT